jgi:DNA repair exonuclease SbcCD ATPase subunit
MATTTTTTSTNWLSTHWSWVLSHLLIVALIGGLVWGAVYGVNSLIASHDAKTEARYSQLLVAQTAQTKAIEDKLSADEQAHQAIENQLIAQLAADQAAMKQRDALNAQLVAKIAQMTAPQVVADLQPKLRAGTATLLADGVKLDVPAARDVDEQITEGANAKTDLATTQADLAKETTIAGNAQADLATAKTAISAEQAKNTDQVKACAAEVATVKAEARKGKMKWFVIGYVSGFLTRVLTVK